MKIPDRLKTLMEYGVIEEVIRPLMSGKEAQVYVVRAQGEVCVAKVYKSAIGRSFRQRAMYTEGRKTRNSRDQRAMSRRSKHGKAVDEEAWRSTEVDMIYRLKNAGVCVPQPICFESSVLVMEMVSGLDGSPAPRLAEVTLSVDEARAVYSDLIQQVVRMLSVGVVHGDLSDFNILLGVNGPVIIDFPQSVDAAQNNNARALLLRDVQNLHDFLKAYTPTFQPPPFAEEMWDLYRSSALTAETTLTGEWVPSKKRANLRHVHELIDDALAEEMDRREREPHPRRRRRRRR